jgi:hypothetical protein
MPLCITVRKDWRKLVLVDLPETTAQLWQSTKPPRAALAGSDGPCCAQMHLELASREQRDWLDIEAYEL